jgi:hypothetical protein
MIMELERPSRLEGSKRVSYIRLHVKGLLDRDLGIVRIVEVICRTRYLYIMDLHYFPYRLCYFSVAISAYNIHMH